MNILHTVARIRTGGINSLLLQNLRHMVNPKLEHFVAVMEDGGDPHLIEQYEYLGYQPIRIGHSGSRSFPETLRNIVRLIGRNNIDLIHSHHTLDHLYCGAASYFTGCIFIASMHGNPWDAAARGHGEQPSWKSKLFNTISQRVAFNAADVVVAVSRAVQEGLVQHCSAPVEKLRVLYNGIDTISFSERPSEKVRPQLQRELGLDPTARILLNVGRLHTQKNQRVLIPMMQHIIQYHEDVVLLIAGDGELRDNLSNYIEEAGMEEHIRLLGHRNDVPALLDAADAFVFPSMHEGLGIAALEAMASGTPIVASAIAPMTEFIRSEETGYLAAPTDPEGLAKRVLRVFSHPQEAERVARAAKNYVNAEFDIRMTSSALESLYLEQDKNESVDLRSIMD